MRSHRKTFLKIESAAVQGIAWMTLSGLCLVGVTGIVRWLGSELNPIQAAFIRYVFGLILVVPIFIKLRLGGQRPKRIGLLAIRGAIHGMAVMFWFFAMTQIPVAEVTALGFTSSIFITIGAIIFLREPIYLHRIIAVAVGLVGTMVILRPGIQVINIGATVLLISAFLFSCSLLMAKTLTKTETNTTIVAFLSLFATITLLPFAIIVWKTPNAWELFWLLMTAILATSGHYAMNRAFQISEITALQPVMFFQLVWATLLGFIMFNESPDIWVWIGGGIILATATISARRDRRIRPV